ncbi:hypothetical protein [Paraburkholderia caledonica]|uniref:hypothetical protein n=1 Tax=Paraburkholderia caledonica TaxID=134536 RepID=UPI000B48FF2F|nr:hypothetical protein BWU74_18135 [Burkholderia sp. Bk]
MTKKIQQGVKAPDTTPTQIRIDKEQLRMLKILAAVNQTTISNIVRESLGAYIESHLGSADAQKAFAKFVTEASEGASPQERAAQERLNKRISATKTED